MPEPGRPQCTILAGTNGSGKTSLFPDLGLKGEFVNADLVAQSIMPDDPGRASVAAGRRVLARLDVLIEGRMDFVYETTLTSRQALSTMARARSAGFDVGLAFVFLGSAEENVARVVRRVAQGGHAIPETDVRRRFGKSFDRLEVALPLADEFVALDNTRPFAERVLSVRGTEVVETGLDPGRPHVRLAVAAEKALGLGPGTLSPSVAETTSARRRGLAGLRSSEGLLSGPHDVS